MVLPVEGRRRCAASGYILGELGAHDWNMTRTAEKFGIERNHLYRKLKTYGITPPKYLKDKEDNRPGIIM